MIALTLVAAACGGEDRELVGYQREPVPVVSEFELPDLSNGGAAFPLRAEPGELLLVYFGYTNCPDFCPTTLSDARLARQRLDDPSQVAVAMVAIDPDRDLPILAEYVGGFFPERGHALGTDDPSLLARVAAPFGAQYDVSTNDDGEIDVAHTTQLYAINDAGEIVLTWQFGVSIEDLAADMAQLLESSA